MKCRKNTENDTLSVAKTKKEKKRFYQNMRAVCGSTKTRCIKEQDTSVFLSSLRTKTSCFQLDMAYGNFKYLPRRTTADKVLRDKALNTAKDPKYDSYK